MSHQLPPLPYAYNALEKAIDAQTMEIHHTKHHQAYIDKLNAALEKHNDLMDKPVADLLMHINDIPEDIRTAVRNHGGGHHNHSLFWKIMSPEGGSEPQGELLSSIESSFDSFEAFKSKFNDAAATQFGSGWAWLAVNNNGGLEVFSTPNQDSPLMENKFPILGLDVWEHAYYLRYQNKRPDYISSWWDLVNWNQVNENFQQARSA